MEQTNINFKSQKVRNVILISMATFMAIMALWMGFSLSPAEQTALTIYRNQVEWQSLQTQIDTLTIRQEAIHDANESLRSGLFHSNQ